MVGLAVLLSLAPLLAACGGDDAAGADGGVSGALFISGSSTVEPISTRVAELLEDVAPGVEVTVDGPGTGDGFVLFCHGEIDVADASRAISEREAATCAENGVEFVELEIAFDGMAVLTNPENPIDCITFQEIWGLMSGPAEAAGVDRWNEAGSVEGVTVTHDLPDAPLDIVAPGTESGTYDSFVEIVLEEAAEQVGYEGDELIRTDFAGQSEDNVIIQGIGGSSSSFGWVGLAFAEANADTVEVLEVDDGESGCVAPSAATVSDGSYPVSRPLYVYVNTAKAAEKPALVTYVDFYLGGGYEGSVSDAFGPGRGYITLPEDRLAETIAAWEAHRPAEAAT